MKKFLLFLTLLVSAIGLTHAKEAYFTISFASSTSTTALKTGNFITTGIVNECQKYVSSCDEINTVYPSIRLGNGTNPGSVTFTLAEDYQVNATKIVVNAKTYNTDVSTINVNNIGAQDLSSTATDYSFNLSGTEKLTSITLASGGTNVKKARAYVYKVTVYYEGGTSGDGKITTTLSFPQASYTANIGETFSTPTPKLTGAPETATISWESSNTAVANIDANSGAITIGETAGSTIITATYAGDDTHTSATASFTLEVTDPNDKSVTDEVTSACLSDKNNGSYAIYTYKSTTGAVYTTRAIIENNTFRLNKATETYFCVSTAPANYKLSKIVLHKTKGSNAVKIYASTTAYTTQGNNPPGGSLIRTTETAIGDYTIDFTNDSDPSNKPLKETNYVAFYVVGPGGVTNFSSIDVTWEPTTSEGEITKDPALSFDTSVCYATLGEDFVEPTLSTATGVTGVVYSSSDSKIASVNAETGEVTAIKVGTVTITANKEADETFDGQEVSYELNVLAAETYLSTDDMSNRSDLTNDEVIVDKDIAVGDAVIYFDGSSARNKTKYYLSEGIRFYADNSLIVTAPEGKYLTKVTFIGISQGDVLSLTPSYGTIDKENNCWLCNGEAQNSVVLSNSAQIRFKAIIIEYNKYKLAHGESTSSSEVTFLENTNSNNNLQLFGTFTKSTSLTVDSYVIRVNDIVATTIEGTADDFTLTGLPYIKDATFTIAPVVDGVELPQEALDDVKMINLDDFKYEFIGNDLIWLNDKATEAPYYIGTVMYFADAFGKEVTDLNYLVDVTADGYEGEFSWVDGGFTYSIANVLEVSELYNGLPKVSDIDPAPKITINVVPSYRFNYDAKYSSLLTSETPLSAPARAAENLTQIYTCASQPLQCTIDVTAEVSGVEGVTVDGGAAVEYFNLQGVRVDGDLAPGIYIRRQGQSVSKVRIN